MTARPTSLATPAAASPAIGFADARGLRLIGAAEAAIVAFYVVTLGTLLLWRRHRGPS